MPTIKVKFNKHKHKRNIWITNEIIAAIKERDDLYITHKMTSSDSLEYETQKANLKTINSNIKKSIREAKKKYYDDLFKKFKSDMKGTWKTISEILNKSKNKRSFPKFFRDESNNIITDKHEIANKFNDFFASIGNKLAQNINIPTNKSFKKYLTKQHHANFKFLNVNEESINNIIDKLAPKPSSGFDGLSTKLILQVSYKG